MNRLIFYSLCTFMTGVTVISAGAQTTVTGRLVDKETGKPVKDAVITQTGTDAKTTTNALGFFQLQVDSVVSVEIESVGYSLMQVRLGDASNVRVEIVKDQVNDLTEENNYAVYEKQASFPGGMHLFYEYIMNNLRIPKEVKNGKFSGKVLVEFVVDSTGLIPPGEIRIKQGLCNSCDEEAIRLIKGSPQWEPGIQKNRRVGVRMVMPIVFRGLF